MLAAIALVSVGMCGAEEKAHLLVQKAQLTNRPFAGKDLPIRYRIFNVGARSSQATQGQILSQSPTDATRFWWHLCGS